MKKKLLGTILAIIFIIPCLFLLAACSEQPDRLIPVDDDDITYIEIFDSTAGERKKITNRNRIESFCEAYGGIKMTLSPGKTNVDTKLTITTETLIYVYTADSLDPKYTIEIKAEKKEDNSVEYFFYRTANVEGNVTNQFNYVSYAATEHTLADMLRYADAA